MAVVAEVFILQKAINKLPKKNSFIWKYGEAIPDCDDWEKSAVVLDKREEMKGLQRGW